MIAGPRLVCLFAKLGLGRPLGDRGVAYLLAWARPIPVSPGPEPESPADAPEPHDRYSLRAGLSYRDYAAINGQWPILAGHAPPAVDLGRRPRSPP